jgi:hypothetical protein
MSSYNLDEFIEIRKLLLTSPLESLPHFRSMLPVVRKNCPGVDSFSAPETTRAAFDSPRRRLIYAAFLGSHSCFFSLSISKLSLQPFATSATSFLNLKWSASPGRTSSPATSRPSIGSSNPRV